MADGRSRPRGMRGGPRGDNRERRRMDHAEAWWYLSKDEKKRWHETHRWPARMAGVLRRPEEGGFDCAFEVSAASSDLPGASDCALAPPDATNVQDKRHFQKRTRAAMAAPQGWPLLLGITVGGKRKNGTVCASEKRSRVPAGAADRIVSRASAGFRTIRCPSPRRAFYIHPGTRSPSGRASSATA